MWAFGQKSEANILTRSELEAPRWRKELTTTGADGIVFLDIVSRAWGGKRLVTITLMNLSEKSKPVSEKCFFQCGLRPSILREDQLTMETKLEQIAVKAVNQLPKSVVREIRTPRCVGAGGGRPPPATRWVGSNGYLYRDNGSNSEMPISFR